jgi:hypothetical protein
VPTQSTRDLRELARRDSIDASLIFVRLLVSDVDELRELLLGEGRVLSGVRACARQRGGRVAPHGPDRDRGFELGRPRPSVAWRTRQPIWPSAIHRRNSISRSTIG